MSLAKLLVVDDELDICEFLTQFFESKGFKCKFATNGKDALEIVEDWNPHVVLLDIKMEEMDGIEVLKRIKQYDNRIGVLMVTGVMDEDLGIKAMDLGASDFVLKPINLDYLESSVVAKILAMLA